MSAAIFETNSLSTPLILIIVCFSTVILISFGILKLTSWLNPIWRFKISPFKFALNPTPLNSNIFSWPFETPVTALFIRLLYVPHIIDVFLSIFFSTGWIWSSLSNIFEEKILSLIERVLVPFGPVIVRFEPSIFTEDSFGIKIFFFPILDIKKPYKLFHHQHCFFLHQYHSLHLSVSIKLLNQVHS